MVKTSRNKSNNNLNTCLWTRSSFPAYKSLIFLQGCGYEFTCYSNTIISDLNIVPIKAVISIIALTVNPGNLGGEVAVQYIRYVRHGTITYVGTARTSERYLSRDGTYARTVHTSGRYIRWDGTRF